MRPERCHWNVNTGSNGSHLKLNGGHAKLLDASSAHRAAVAHKGGGFPVPLRRDEHKAVRRGGVGSPVLKHVIFVRRAARHSGRHGLVEERHWEVAEVEKPRLNRLSLPKLVKNPLSRLFREPALACAADDY